MGVLIGNVKIVDADGRKVPLISQLGMLRVDGGPDRHRRAARARHEMGGMPSGQEWRRIVGYGILLLPLFVVLALAPTVMTFKLDWPVWAVAIAVIPLGLGPAALTIWLTRRVIRERIVRMMLRAEFCPSCGHDLTGLASDEAGRRVCAECGSAWIESWVSSPARSDSGTPGSR